MNNPKIYILFSLFIALLVGMNMLGSKIVEFLGVPVSVGIFMAPFSFLITDIVEEVYGKSLVKYFILGGIISSVLVFIFTFLFINLEPHSTYSFDKEYKLVFGSSLRIIAASVIAFSLAQANDVIVFEWWKKRTKGKALWLRNNFSTIISQLIDTLVFMLIAFYQISPEYTLLFILELSLPFYLLKVGFAIIDTPLVYLGVSWLRKQTN